MAGISSRALGKLGNKIKFQKQEFTEDFDVDYYEFKYRMHDPQIGRFIQVDPLADKYVHNSTYAFSENKVTSHVELEGLEAVSAEIMREAEQAAVQAGPLGKAIVVGGAVVAGVVLLAELVHKGVEAGGANNSMTLIPESMNKDMMKYMNASPKAELEKEVTSLERSTRSLEKNVKEHQQKLDDYKKNPDKYDNKGELKNANPEQREKVINGRIKSLEKQMIKIKAN